MTCAQFDQLLDAYLDGTVDPPQRAEIDAHIEGCPTCRAESRQLRSVLDAAHRLPRSIEPPKDLWSDIAPRLAGRTTPRIARGVPWRRWAPLAAAAVLLIVVTAVVTYRFARPEVFVAVQPSPMPTSQAGFAADREYVVAAEDLERVLAAGRGQLSPATVAIIEDNLAVIDAAITEARAALAADPANADLRALLWGAHRQKLALLDRATRLTRS